MFSRQEDFRIIYTLMKEFKKKKKRMKSLYFKWNEKKNLCFFKFMQFK